jgi:hypothetical protein
MSNDSQQPGWGSGAGKVNTLNVLDSFVISFAKNGFELY